MVKAPRTAPTPQTSEQAVIWIRRSLEVLWILSVVMVPLAFVPRGELLGVSQIAYLEIPKIALLKIFAGVMAALWLVEAGLLAGPPLGISRKYFAFSAAGGNLKRLLDWRREQPEIRRAHVWTPVTA